MIAGIGIHFARTAKARAKTKAGLGKIKTGISSIGVLSVGGMSEGLGPADIVKIQEEAAEWRAEKAKEKAAERQASEGTSGAEEKSDEKAPDRPGGMQREVEKGQAPKDVERIDDGYAGGQPHVHLKDGTAINQDGTTHDKKNGQPKPSNKVKKWLKEHGWKVPD